VSLKTSYADIPGWVTKDGSEIRELMHPNSHEVRNQSLAEAIVAPGSQTLLHLHRCSEELYHITKGQGLMTLGKEEFAVWPGDTVLIHPGTPHAIANSGAEPLHILCCCSPAYDHRDTELLYFSPPLTIDDL
jgi:mannose-6-phosphate isomerase-like protein (cupin superfamily)